MANKPLRKHSMDEALKIRLPREYKAKLSQMARATGRSMSEVIRQLIERAEIAGQPDIVLKS